VSISTSHATVSSPPRSGRTRSSGALPSKQPGIHALVESLANGAPSGPRHPTRDELHAERLNHQLVRLDRQSTAAEARHRTLFELAGDPIAVLSPDGILLEVNQRWEEILRRPREAINGLALQTFSADRRPIDLENCIARPFPVARSDGSTVHLELTTTRVDLDGKASILAIGRDTTDIVELREKLSAREREYRTVVDNKHIDAQILQAQRLETVGQLTAGIAHDFNNALAAILASTHFLLESIDEADTERRGDVEDIRNAANRATELAKHLCAFSKRQEAKATALDIGAVISRMDHIFSRVLGRTFLVESKLASDLGTIRADAGEIEQVLLNLILNARDAMPNGGQLTLATRNVSVSAGSTTSDEVADLPEGEWVAFSVTDTGCGMAPATTARIFEAFFTTKPTTGSGLGLSTTYGIVRQRGGHIRVRSAPGEGSTFEIFLPRSSPPPAERASPAAEAATTILVIDDDPAVRSSLARILRARGYTVVQAWDGDEALEVVRRRPVDLILSDVVVAGPDGEAVAAEARARGQDTRLIYISGGPGPKGVPFLPKPFSVATLTEALRQILEGRR
jgi:two-component system, cell cycle sensor histidine kinase and response regulator CckA